MSWTCLNKQRLTTRRGDKKLKALKALCHEETPVTNQEESGHECEEPCQILTDGGNDGSGEEEGAALVPVAGIGGCVFERTHT